MTKKITQDLLTRFIYQETNSKENQEIENAIKADFELREEYNSLLEAQDALPKVDFSPSIAVIDNILNYSKTTHLEAFV